MRSADDHQASDTTGRDAMVGAAHVRSAQKQNKKGGTTDKHRLTLINAQAADFIQLLSLFSTNSYLCSSVFIRGSEFLFHIRQIARYFGREGSAARLSLRQPGDSKVVFRRGFSLIEVMIVVVIIGLLAGIVTYATTGYLERAKRERAHSDIATYCGAVDAWYLANGRYPENQEGLQVLVPAFVKVMRNDPWGRPYQYVQPGRASPYDIISYGADGREGGSGADADITNSDPEVSALKAQNK